MASTGCASDVCYKSHPSGTVVSQVQVCACVLSSNRAGNEWQVGPIKQAPPHCWLPPARCSPAQPGPCLPMSPVSSALWRPGESQQKDKEPEGYLMGYLTIASVLASLCSTVPTLYSAHLFVCFSFSCLLPPA